MTLNLILAWLMPPAVENDTECLELLRTEHRLCCDRFITVEEAETLALKRRAFDALVEQLSLHALVEEAHVHPLLDEPASASLLEQHRHIKEALADLLALDPGDPAFDQALAALKAQVAAHVRDEDAETCARLSEMEAPLRAALAQRIVAAREDLARNGQTAVVVTALPDAAALS